MAKFYGEIGFSKSELVKPGVYEDRIIARQYAGDVLQNSRRIQNSGNLIDDVVVSNRISIVADDFATQNLPFARYVVWNGNAFEVTSYEYAYPRIILTLGGLYNGQQASTADRAGRCARK